MTAFEELKAWCEKHLGTDGYKAVPKSKDYYATIYFEPLINDNNIPCFVFDTTGAIEHIDVCTNDEMIEHIYDYKRNSTIAEDKLPNDSEPAPTSIGGLMVRKMIEEYERKMQQSK